MVNTKIIMSPEKVLEYHTSYPPVYFKECPECKKVQPITVEYSPWVERDNLDKDYKQLLKQTRYTTSFYCPDCAVIKEQELRDLILRQAKVFMWKDKGQPKYDGEK